MITSKEDVQSCATALAAAGSINDQSDPVPNSLSSSNSSPAESGRPAPADCFHDVGSVPKVPGQEGLIEEVSEVPMLDCMIDEHVEVVVVGVVLIGVGVASVCDDTALDGAVAVVLEDVTFVAHVCTDVDVIGVGLVSVREVVNDNESVVKVLAGSCAPAGHHLSTVGSAPGGHQRTRLFMIWAFAAEHEELRPLDFTSSSGNRHDLTRFLTESE